MTAEAIDEDQADRFPARVRDLAHERLRNDGGRTARPQPVDRAFARPARMIVSPWPVADPAPARSSA